MLMEGGADKRLRERGINGKEPEGPEGQAPRKTGGNGGKEGNGERGGTRGTRGTVAFEKAPQNFYEGDGDGYSLCKSVCFPM